MLTTLRPVSWAAASRTRPGAASAAVRALLLAGTLVLSGAASGAAATDAADEDASVLDEARIAEALDVILERYVDEGALDRENLTSGAIRGIVEALGDDGHTLYLTPEELRIEEDALRGRVVGIGVVIDQRAGSPQVISVVDGSPADRAGLRAGDIIASVDGTDTSRLSVAVLADLVRGDVGTTVQLGIDRPGQPERLEVGIERDDVEIDPVAWAFAPGSDVAVVRIVQFSSQAGRETRSAVEAAIEAGATGLVLDLRGNPGGLVDEALVVAGSFLAEGVAYQEQGRDGVTREIRIEPDWLMAPHIPLMVLVDFGTASSGEILTAALRDNGRARVIGERTYGTGTVLNTFELSDGSALRVGVRRWLTPAGEAVFRVGIAPDEVVGLPPGAVALEPADLVSMSGAEFAASDDMPLRRAVDRIEASTP